MRSESSFFWIAFLIAGFFLSCTTPVPAVVVAGASGGGNTSNNTTQEQLESELGISDASFYQNVVAYSDAGSVYLGWRNTDNGARAYVLTANHISFASTMIIGGITYNVTPHQIANTDLKVLELTQTQGLMPALEAVTLASSTPSASTSIIMVGYGQQRVQNATTNAFVSDAVTLETGVSGYTTQTGVRVKRWGTNTTTTYSGSSTIVIGNTVEFMTRFDQPSPGTWLSTNEAQGVLGDSGGAAFSSAGVLLGIVSTVATVGSTNNQQAAFGNYTFFADVATYKTQIENITGVNLIPEPSPVGLAVLAGGFLLGLLVIRRQKAKTVPRIDCGIG